MRKDVLRMMTWKGCYNCKCFDFEYSICNESNKDLSFEDVKDNGSPDWCLFPVINPGETYTFEGV